MPKLGKQLSVLFTIIVAFDLIVLFLPSVIVFLSSFSDSKILSFPPVGFTVRWYEQLARTDWFLRTLMNSVYAAVLCTILSIPVGVSAAIALNRYRVRGVNVLQVYLLLPFTIPLIVSGIGLLFIYGRLDLLGQVWPIGLALMVINIPFMIWSVSANLNSLDRYLEFAARNLGAEEVQTLLFVTLPALLPGIISGALLMFILGLNEFITSMILVTVKSMTLPVALYTSIKTNLTPFLGAVSSLYILIAAVSVWALDRLVGLKEYLRMR